MTNQKLLYVAASALVTIAAVISAPVHAGETMDQLIRYLRNSGAISQDAYEILKKSMEEEEKKVADVAKEAAKEEIEAAKKDDFEVNTKGKLEIKSADGDFKWRLGGRIHLDTAVFNNDEGADGTSTDFADSSEVRRARLEMSGTLWKYWDFKSQFDFAPGDEVEVKDLYIRSTYFKPTNITVGHFKQPFSLEEVTSSNNITFMERALPNIFAPSRDLGIMVQSHGDMWQAAAGYFSDGPDLEEGSFDDVGFGEDESSSATGRVTFSPIHEETKVVHIGAGVTYRRPQGEAGIRIRQRPEAHATSIRLVDTGALFGVDHVLTYGGEAAIVYGPFSLQGEYIRSDFDRGSLLSDPDFDGYYVFGSWLLTGESRVYDHETGVFEGVKPNRVFGKGGWGALELGLRFSGLDLEDEDVFGGEEHNLTGGMTWYPNANLKFMANYVHVLDLDSDDPTFPFEDAEPGVFQVRAQAHW